MPILDGRLQFLIFLFVVHQSLVGKVISAKMNSTVNVRVTRQIAHPIYHKRVKHYKNYLAHVASVKPKDGDIVKIEKDNVEQYTKELGELLVIEHELDIELLPLPKGMEENISATEIDIVEKFFDLSSLN